jgi:lipid-A-disaccharide synthase
MVVPKLMLVAAEASGDALGAGLARALRDRLGDVRLIGVGGARLAAEGLVSAFPIEDISIVGVLDTVLGAPRVLTRAAEVARLARLEQPDAAVLIDSWGFSYQAAVRIRRAAPKVPLIKYVAPQVWASRPSRTKAMARTFDHVLAIHAFEPPIFEAAGLAATFVGNPVLARDFSGADPLALRQSLGIGPQEPVLLVLPGSRMREIVQMTPPFEAAVNLLKARWPALQVIVPAAETVAEAVKARIAGWPHRAHVVEGEAARLSAMKAATVALACSGTVTTELALAGCPMVAAYRVDLMTAVVMRAMITTKWVTLLNIAAQRTVVPELILEDCTGPRLAAAVAGWLEDEGLRARQIADQNAALDLMGREAGDPAGRAADALVAVMKARGVLA